MGPIGHVRDGQRDRAIARACVAGCCRGIPVAAAEPVPLITATVAMDGALVRAATSMGARGLVVAATGSGNTHPDVLAAAVGGDGRRHPGRAGHALCLGPGLGRATASRVAAHAGSQPGAIPAGTLGAPKARILLALGLGAGLDDTGLRRLFAG